jgi:DNA-binding response OmpR family regulator
MHTTAPKRILWADDEIDLLKPHILYLEERGYSVTPVPTGEDAIVAAGQQDFDVVLLDEMMPGLGGLETLERLQQKDASLPVILITKSEQETLMNEALGKQITDYLIKPVNPSQIFLAVKKVFESPDLVRSQAARDYVSHVQRLATLDTGALDWREWIEVATEMSRWDLEVERLGDQGLEQAHQDQRRDLNTAFGRFIEQQYPEWVHSEPENRPLLSHDLVGRYAAPLVREGERVVLIVLDCMRLDHWLAITPLLEPFFHVETDYYYSLLPTATPYSRNAIFGGLLIDDLGKKNPDLWSEKSDDERSRNRFERPLLERQLSRLDAVPKQPLKYIKVYTAEESQSIRKQVHSFDSLGVVALVYNFIDILSHGRSESEILKELAPDEKAFRAVTRAWFQHSPMFETFQELAKLDCTVICTTDHGSVMGKRAAKVMGSRETSTNLRYKFGVNLNVDNRQGITIKKPETYRLPDDGVNKNYIVAKEDYYFVYPTRFHEFERQFRDTFQHGGVSLEEMIVPNAVLTPRSKV